MEVERVEAGRLELARARLGEWEPAGGVETAEGATRLEVLAMRAGEANGLRYPAEVLAASVQAGLWRGAAVFLDHPDALDATRAGGRTLGDLAGVVEEAWYEDGVRARLRLAGPKGPLVAELARQWLADREAGRAVPRIGLSADLLVLRDAGGLVRRIQQVHSLDVVFDPAAGGTFLRVLNASDGTTASQPMPEEGNPMSTNEVLSSDGAAGAQEPALSRELALLQCEHALNAALRDAGLPEALERAVRQRFAGRLFHPQELGQAIAAQRATWAELLEAGVVKGLGEPRPAARAGVSGMLDELDRVRLAWERALGLPIPERHRDIPRLSGIRELYITLTGDHEFRGRLFPERALLANATTATMTGLVADGLNKVMLQAYNRREKWWQSIVVNRDLDRFQDMKMIRVHGFSSLSTVNEGAAYTEASWDDVMETAGIAKKGNYIGITLEMIMADDMDAVRTIPTLLGSAAYNTVSDMVSEVFTANAGLGPLMADGYHLFDAAHHGNLRTAALSLEEFDNVALAMMNQTEPGSGRKLAVPPAFLLVPTSLRSTALTIRNSTYIPGSGDNDINPWYQGFEVIVVPPWSDANNWAAVASPTQVEGIVMGWLFGRQEPEIFVADSEVMGSMFTNDEMRIKVRWFLCVGVADYRGLHKNNVA